MSNLEAFFISKNATILDALRQIENVSDGVIRTIFVCDENSKILGTLTEGDCRRSLISGASLETEVYRVMYTDFTYIIESDFDIKIIDHIRKKKINFVPLLNRDKTIVKILDFSDGKSFIPVDAILMAGGKGERLRPLTLTTPKPLLQIGEKVIIDYNVDNLIKYGIKDIYVTTNYLAEQIERHFEVERYGVKINCVREKKYLGTIGSVKLIPEINSNELLVMNSDLFTNIDFEDFYRQFVENEADMSAAAIPYSINVPYGIFDLDELNIQGVKEKPTFNYYANAGIYLFKKSLLELIPDDIYFNATDFMELLISKGKKVTHYPLVGYWIDIGKPADYQKAQDFVKYIK